MRRLLTLTFVILHSSFVIAQSAGDVLFSQKAAGGLAPSWVTPAAPPSVFGQTAGGVISSFQLGSGLALTDGVVSAAPAWSAITSTPTTLAGYGIVDAQPLNAHLTSLAALTSTAFGRALLELADAEALRTAAGITLGTAAGDVVQLDGAAKLPAVDGSQLTNLPAASAALPDNYITGFAASATQGATSYTVTAGVCRDSTNSHDIRLTTSKSKVFATTWAAGTGNGGSRAGDSYSSSLPVYVYAIKNPTTGEVDIWNARTITSLAAALPSGYTVYRRVGYLWPNSSTQINGLATDGDYCHVLTTSSGFVLAATLTVTTGEQAQAIMAPPNCHVVVGVNVYHASTAGVIRVTGGDSAWGSAALATATGATQTFGGSAATATSQVYHLMTNSSRQIRLRSSQTSTNVYYWVIGWRDTRGAF